jgi:hypothetical protein
VIKVQLQNTKKTEWRMTNTRVMEFLSPREPGIWPRQFRLLNSHRVTQQRSGEQHDPCHPVLPTVLSSGLDDVERSQLRKSRAVHRLVIESCLLSVCLETFALDSNQLLQESIRTAVHANSHESSAGLVGSSILTAPYRNSKQAISDRHTLIHGQYQGHPNFCQ